MLECESVWLCVCVCVGVCVCVLCVCVFVCVFGDAGIVLGELQHVKCVMGCW